MSIKIFLRITTFTITITTILFFASCAGFDNRQGDDSPGADYERIGTVNADLTHWNWFYRLSIDERREALVELAAEKAREQFGYDVIIRTETLEGRWNPKSLLMLLGAIGNVEDSAIEASVWKKRAEPEHEYGYRYAVIPAADYKGDWGFMQVEYKTREQLIADLDKKLAAGEITEESYNYRLSRLPDTGKIFITLAREEITNAISRWFTFTCTWKGKSIFRKRGIEDIPYVYGTDKLWWNDMSYNVGPAWDGELKLEIYDSFREELFSFRVVKERYTID
ncbi:MAG: hypothetical protein PQJ61_02385 [Spirochaetales bacterium]|uniref:Uncharacterized protein n=1 Tax=Candidatus Thalassospirochaeta sargassi TaxID=3119039 RepID=A0AAJ1ID43_9SPIO|nr:hypothetical protein [Spirochaetales bacterium]